MLNRQNGLINIGYKENIVTFLNIIASLLFYICLPFYFLERVIHQKSKGWKKKFGFCEFLSGKIIMIHGCSVGEISAADFLVNKIKEKFPDYKLVLTTSTITGQEVANKKYSELVDYITYFPFDSIHCVERFLKRINPSMVFILETEVWPIFTSSCKKRNIPLYIINGRISDKSFNSYKLLKFYFKNVLDNYNCIYTQSNNDTKRFIDIGAKPEKVKFMGNIKFNIKKVETSIDIGQKGYRVLIAGSTHENENKILVGVYAKLKKNFQDLKLLIAPRHLKNVCYVEEYCKKNDLKYELRSSGNNFSDSVDVIILDTYGELGKMYSICDVAYIGGSLNKTGGHNPLEACIYDKPVISGNCVTNFRDIYGILTSVGAAKIVKNETELFNEFNNILNDKELYDNMSKACSLAFEQQKSATDVVINVISENV